MKTSDIFKAARNRISLRSDTFCCVCVQKVCNRLIDGPRRWEECKAIMLRYKPEGAERDWGAWWYMGDIQPRLEFLDKCIAHALEQGD